MSVPEAQAVAFERVYREARERGLLRMSQEEALRALLEQNAGVATQWVEPAGIKIFSTIRGFTAATSAGRLFFPIDPEADVADADGLLLRAREVFLEQGWVPPCYVQRRYIKALIGEIESASPAARHSILEGWLRQTYTPGWLAAMMTERYAKADHVRDFASQIREAILAFHLGLTRASVATLLPVLEGIARGLMGKFDPNPPPSRKRKGAVLHRSLQRVMEELIHNSAYADHDWAPFKYTSAEFFDKFDEHVQIVRSLDLYFANVLYRNVDPDSATGHLSRHAVAHGLVLDFDDPSNFHKLVTLLDALTFVAILITGSASLFAPEDTDASRAFMEKLTAASIVADAFSGPETE